MRMNKKDKELYNKLVADYNKLSEGYDYMVTYVAEAVRGLVDAGYVIVVNPDWEKLITIMEVFEGRDAELINKENE